MAKYFKGAMSMKSLCRLGMGLGTLIMSLAMTASPSRASDAGVIYPAQDPMSIIHPEPIAPTINGPRIVGASPGKPFLFLIPATGQGPLGYSAENLPKGLKLDPKTGIMSGALEKDGVTVVEITVTGPKGAARRSLTIVAGKDQLALTPPMGWNSWNAWGLSVNAEEVKQAADCMVKSGLAAHGFQYVNIDDGWEKRRDANGEIVPNEKFPDMKALADYVHSRGLKLGIYSSPGPKTCGGYEGSLGHQAQDAATYAKWGIDYLKYDWCSGGAKGKSLDPKLYQETYFQMGKYLKGLDRDIVYSIDPAGYSSLWLLDPTERGVSNNLCRRSLKGVWCWGESAGGNLWRTSVDIKDNWFIMSRLGFGANGLEKFAGPGHWTDPDMLVVGKVGWGPNLHQSRLSPDEQITHLTLWSMLAAPLLTGCDLCHLDDLALALLTNDEVLGVDQDPLGKQASRVARSGETEVWSRPLWDGTFAVALFNRSQSSRKVMARWSDLGLSGIQPARDLWQQKDLGDFQGSFQATVPAHGAIMLKVGKPVKKVFQPVH
jgi:alpha-galactosidase